MRRISLALALFGAVAAAGCGGGAKPASTAAAKGTAGVNFNVTLNNQGGGTVSDGTNTCAANTTCTWTYSSGTPVTLTATAGSLYFNGWFGDCSGTDVCALTGNADKYVVAFFSTSPQGHPNWAAGHGAQLDLRCTNCHGAQLTGAGIAPSCSSCHETPFGKHFDTTAAAWNAHGSPGTGWTQACERCHNAKGYQDYVGADGVANNLSGSFDVDQIFTTDTAPTAYNVGTLTCKTCHNSASDPTTPSVINAGPPVTVTQTGITSVLFPSLIKQTTNHVSGVCATCHQARESTASESTKIMAKVTAASQGLGIVTVSGATTGSTGTTSTLITGKVTVAANAYVGYTAIFSGSVTPALNGAKSVVSANTAAANAASTLTFATALPAAPAFTTLPMGTSPSADGASLYPTVGTGSTTTTLVDGNRTWTANQWNNYYVFFMTGANAGKYSLVTANDATSLTFAPALAAAVAGDFYIIVPQETPAVLDAAITGFSWNNPHYLGAAATLYGSTAAGWYQYPVNYASTTLTTPPAYNGRESFHEGAASVSNLNAGSFTYQGQTYSWAANTQNINEHKCTYCHNAHTLEVADLNCATAACHHHTGTATGSADGGELQQTMSWLKGNKPASKDWDGNGTIGSTHDELEGLKVIFLQAIQAYAAALGNTNGGTSQLCFNDANYSYWFVATASDIASGTCNSTTGWAAAGTNTVWTPRLARATYNYKFAMKDPGAWAHNPKYAAQIMFDAIQDLNAGLQAAGKATVPFAGVRP